MSVFPYIYGSVYVYYLPQSRGIEEDRSFWI